MADWHRLRSGDMHLANHHRPHQGNEITMALHLDVEPTYAKRTLAWLLVPQ